MKQDVFPTLLLKETTVLVDWDGTIHPYSHYYPMADLAEAENEIAKSERPGYGQQYDSIRYEIFTLNGVLVKSVDIEPMTMADVALEYHQFKGDWKIDVKLYNTRNTVNVFWSASGNSFAIVKPHGKIDPRYVTKQGVILMAINGIGEIRWVVSPTDNFGENADAFKHFKLEF